MSRAPGTSAPCPRPRPLSRAIRRIAAAPVAMPIGMLMKKIQCQLIDSVSTPPASRPTEPPADATNAYTPIALASSRGSGNIVTIMPRMTADVIAPPMPCTKRAPTSISWLCAVPHSSDAPVNSARPARNTVRRPIRSPRRPASSSSPPNAIRYALTTQARLDAGESEVVLDRWKRDVHDRDVENDHEHAHAQHVQREPAGAVVVCLGCHICLLSSSYPSSKQAPRFRHDFRVEFIATAPTPL